MFEPLISVLNKNPLTTEERSRSEKFDCHMRGRGVWGFTPNMVSRGLTNGFRDRGPNILKPRKKDRSPP